VSHNKKWDFISVSTLEEIKTILSDVEQNSVIFLDVDDTLITPRSKLFRSKSPYRALIDDIKRDREDIPHFEIILSRWRLQRQTELVCEGWADFFKEFKRKFPLYGLTKMETGSLGDIPSMEEWRYKELLQKGLEFTPLFEGKEKEILLTSPNKPYDATFYKGIFTTGSFRKGELIYQYLLKESPEELIFVDDRQEHLHDVYEACYELSIPFTGICFKGETLIPGAPDPAVAKFQKNHLLNHHKWLEDEEAERRVDSFKASH